MTEENQKPQSIPDTLQAGVAESFRQHVESLSGDDPIQKAKAARFLSAYTETYLNSPAKVGERVSRADESDTDEFMNTTPFVPEELRLSLMAVLAGLPGDGAEEVRAEWGLPEPASEEAIKPKTPEAEFNPDELTAATRMVSSGLKIAAGLEENGHKNKLITANMLWPPQVTEALETSMLHDHTPEWDETRVKEVIKSTQIKLSLQLRSAWKNNKTAIAEVESDLKAL